MQPGVYESLPNADYHASSALSRSGLTLLQKRSPLHYWRAYIDPNRPEPEDTPAFRLGSAVHAYVLEPAAWASDYAVAPDCDRRTKKGKETWTAFVEEVGDRTILKEAEAAQAVAIGQSVLKHPLAHSLVRSGASEVSMFWEDEETGVLCRCRPDHLPPSGRVVDLKTTQDASYDSFRRSAFTLGYHHQAAFYLEGCRAVGVDVNDFAFVVVEKTPPYAVALYRAPEHMIEVGRQACREAIRTYAACLESGEWPGYGQTDSLTDLELPLWAR